MKEITIYKTLINGNCDLPAEDLTAAILNCLDLVNYHEFIDYS